MGPHFVLSCQVLFFPQILQMKCRSTLVNPLRRLFPYCGLPPGHVCPTSLKLAYCHLLVTGI